MSSEIDDHLLYNMTSDAFGLFVGNDSRYEQ
jgi:hypothetical protein